MKKRSKSSSADDWVEIAQKDWKRMRRSLGDKDAEAERFIQAMFPQEDIKS